MHVDPVTTWVSQAGLRRRTAHSGQQRRRGGVGRRHAARLRGVRAQLDLPGVHDPGDPACEHRDRAGLPDPGDRRDGARPEFVAIAALGLALVRRRGALFALAAAHPGRRVRGRDRGHHAGGPGCAAALGWITIDDVTGPRPDTAFIYTPDKWSFIVALIAAAAGVLSLTWRRWAGCPGSSSPSPRCRPPATSPWGSPSGVADEVSGSALQLLVNIIGHGRRGLGHPDRAAAGVASDGAPPQEAARTPLGNAQGAVRGSLGPLDPVIGRACMDAWMTCCTSA